MSNVAREYSKALFNSLEGESHKMTALNFLKGISEAIKTDSSLLEQIKSKNITAKQAKEVFGKLVPEGPLQGVLANFFFLLIDKRRFEVVHDLVDCFQEEFDEEQGVLRGVVKSAAELDQAQRVELEQRLSKKLDKKVLLSYKKDEKVLAGLRVEVGPYTFDDTVETHIKNIKENLNRSWS